MPVPQGTYNYWLAPYVWESIPGDAEGWVQPAGTVSGVDLRPIPAQELQVVALGFGLFAIDPAAPDPDGGFLLFNGFEQRLPRDKRREFESRFDLGDGDLDLPDFKRSLFTLLMDHADITGANGPKPLMPERSSLKLRIWMGGHNGPVYSEGFDKVRHPKVRAMVLEDLKGLRLSERARRVALLREKYKFTEAEMRPAPRGAASLSDNFNRADEDPVVGWDEVDGTYEIISNEFVGQSGGSSWPRTARYSTAMDGPDHEVEVEHLTDNSVFFGSPWARVHASNETGYWLRDRGSGSDFRFQKIQSGSNTAFGSDANVGTNLHTDKIEIDGSTLKGYQDVGSGFVLQLTETDTSISSGDYAGIAMHTSNDSECDNWVAADLGGGAAPVVVRRNLMLLGVGR